MHDLLQHLAQQRFSSQPEPAVRVIVVDNEGSDRVRGICAAWRHWPIHYYHEPSRGISQARNTCLDRTPHETEFFAFIDDDERPQPDWLDQLLLTQTATGADVVVGPVVPDFPDGTPSWIERSGFFLKPRNQARLTDRQTITFAATCNVLLHWRRLCALGPRFDPELGLRGGEDKLFFQRLRRADYRFVWAARAGVRETVPPDRARFRFMLSAEYRGGNVRMTVRARQRNSTKPDRSDIALRWHTGLEGLRVLGSGLFHIVIATLSGRASKDRLAMIACDMAGGVGLLTGAFGVRYEHYR